jgi:hypothetical protein
MPGDCNVKHCNQDDNAEGSRCHTATANGGSVVDLISPGLICVVIFWPAWHVFATGTLNAWPILMLFCYFHIIFWLKNLFGRDVWGLWLDIAVSKNGNTPRCPQTACPGLLDSVWERGWRCSPFLVNQLYLLALLKKKLYLLACLARATALHLMNFMYCDFSNRSPRSGARARQSRYVLSVCSAIANLLWSGNRWITRAVYLIERSRNRLSHHVSTLNQCNCDIRMQRHADLNFFSESLSNAI